MVREFEIQEEKPNMINMCGLERVTGLRPTLTDRFLPKWLHLKVQYGSNHLNHFEADWAHQTNSNGTACNCTSHAESDTTIIADSFEIILVIYFLLCPLKHQQ